MYINNLINLETDESCLDCKSLLFRLSNWDIDLDNSIIVEGGNGYNHDLNLLSVELNGIDKVSFSPNILISTFPSSMSHKEELKSIILKYNQWYNFWIGIDINKELIAVFYDKNMNLVGTFNLPLNSEATYGYLTSNSTLKIFGLNSYDKNNVYSGILGKVSKLDIVSNNSYYPEALPDSLPEKINLVFKSNIKSFDCSKIVDNCSECELTTTGNKCIKCSNNYILKEDKCVEETTIYYVNISDFNIKSAFIYNHKVLNRSINFDMSKNFSLNFYLRRNYYPIHKNEEKFPLLRIGDFKLFSITIFIDLHLNLDLTSFLVLIGLLTVMNMNG